VLVAILALTVSSIKCIYKRLGLLLAAARTWNSLQHVTSAPSMSVFRGRLTAFLFRYSFPWLYRYLCGACAVTVVLFIQLNISFYLLTMWLCAEHEVAIVELEKRQLLEKYQLDEKQLKEKFILQRQLMMTRQTKVSC